MSATRKVLLVASSTDKLTLKGGKVIPTGYYLDEVAIPAQAILAAGYELVVANPLGNRPVMDEASNTAKLFGDDDSARQRAVDWVNSYPTMVKPRTLKSVIEEGLDKYAGVYVPGGHAPMNDLMQDENLGIILRHCHEKGKPTALLCHGPIAVTASMPKARDFRKALIAGDTAAAKAAAAGWCYAGYRMTIFSNAEEKWAEENFLKGQVEFSVEDALRTAGGKVEVGGFFEPVVIADRELITGQNPPADHRISKQFVEALGAAQRREHAA